MTTATRAWGMTSTRQPLPVRIGVVAASLVVFLALLIFGRPDLSVFPEAWNLHLRQPIDAFESWVIGSRATHPLFVYFFEPLSAVIDGALRTLEGLLLALPWPVVILAVMFIALRTAGWGVALFAVLALLFMGAMGLWEQSMQTVALMGVSVFFALALGIPLGILAARSDRLDAWLRPILDAMQTMPAFVYLIPVLLFFGVARVPSVVATVIYALPPAVRLTNLGIRQVPVESVEAAEVFGSTEWQKLIKVQLPLAKPSIMAGVNQTIMMALGIVVIAALIGAGGLGREVLVALQRLQVGQALEAGLAIVFVAVLLDRTGNPARPRDSAARRRPAWIDPSVPQALLTYIYWSTALLALLLILMVHVYGPGIGDFPAALRFSIREPVDAAVRWMRDHLYQIGDLPIGAGPLSDFLTIWLLNPLRSLLQSWLPWPAVILGLSLVAYLSSGWRLALFTAFALLATGLLGLWSHTMDTLSQVLVASAASVAVGLPLGIWSARSDRVQAALRPALDFLQTIPVFVYLVPVIMLFNVGRVPGVIASVLYAVAPLIRLTDLGIRQVPGEAVEAAAAFGSTTWQTLHKVQLPLALPSIMLGVNQTVMMVLSMVVIAGLVGGGALGFEAVNGLAKSELGRGVEAGLAIVLLAVVLDRITQAWASKRH
jgi:glycine betaine/proline transport system permease protein